MSGKIHIALDDLPLPLVPTPRDIFALVPSSKMGNKSVK